MLQKAQYAQSITTACVDHQIDFCYYRLILPVVNRVPQTLVCDFFYSHICESHQCWCMEPSNQIFVIVTQYSIYEHSSFSFSIILIYCTCFWLLAIMNRTSMNILVHVFCQSHTFLLFLIFKKLIYFNWRLITLQIPDVQAGFRKGRETRDQIANIHWIIEKEESSRKTSISALLTMPKPLTVWITINCGKF